MKTKVLNIAAIALTLAICSFSCTGDLEISDATNKQGALTRGTDAGEFFYTDKGEKEYFNIRKDRVIIKTVSETEAKKLCTADNFPSDDYLVGVMGFWVTAPVDPERTDLDDLLKLPGVVDATYGLEYEDGTLQYAMDQIFIQCEGTPQSALAKIGLSENVEAVELFDEYNNIYLVTLNVGLGDLLQICRTLYESGLCKFAEPNFIREIMPNNTHYPDQWGLKNTGQYGGTTGIDIKAEQAWAITRGSSSIKVAVIDDGVDLTHPDLQGNLLSGYDATDGIPGGANGSPYGDNAHGTACAGIVGAINNAIGVVGVASGCKIIPVRIGYDNDADPFWDNFTDARAADGIRYAWQTARADVLSNSWSSGSYSSTVDNTIVNAMTLGRGGKGCVVVFASGNGKSFATVKYPANSDPRILVVGAIDRTGTRSIWNSLQASNYGPELDVVAPGTDIYTTDIHGSDGYDSGDYTSSFYGTSAAAPHVSGIAALILSANPNLTSHQVSDIIEITASNSSSWNDQTGRGLVNAHAAVSFAVNPSYVQTAIDFLIYNNTSQNLNDVHIGLSGSVGNAYVNMFSEDIYSMYRGQSAGYPNYPGTTFAGFPRATISNLNLNVFVSSASQSDLRITAQMDYGIQVSSNLYGGYGHVNLSLPNSTVPPVNGQRRRVTIYIAE